MSRRLQDPTYWPSSLDRPPRPPICLLFQETPQDLGLGCHLVPYLRQSGGAGMRVLKCLGPPSGWTVGRSTLKNHGRGASWGNRVHGDFPSPGSLGCGFKAEKLRGPSGQVPSPPPYPHPLASSTRRQTNGRTVFKQTAGV